MSRASGWGGEGGVNTELVGVVGGVVGQHRVGGWGWSVLKQNWWVLLGVS